MLLNLYITIEYDIEYYATMIFLTKQVKKILPIE